MAHAEEDMPNILSEGNVEEVGASDDVEIDAMKQRLKQLEEEAAQVEAMHGMVQKSLTSSAIENGPNVDKRSIYVGNVDYTVTPEELQEFFKSCGTVNRITILCDKSTGHPKGFAYVEFAEPESVTNSLLLNEKELKGRPLKISPKRTNVPAFMRGAPRRARRARYPAPYGAAPYAPAPYYAPYPSYAPRRGYRGRRASYHPYY
eukprot:TRINITY_DN3310_c0_g1_i1.p1 TRINITY_DN3310_c0_g1~~TRINITY_DN3310_c0_g1_i1.p1  ORF type:complete len:204 (+),score=47.21 TRINITY_DN3310_c0_g1_i1:100-711(+)